MGLYLLILEYFYDKLEAIQSIERRRRLAWIIKYIAFNLMYVPALLFLPKLFYAGEINDKLIVTLLIGGQVALLVYDMAYHYFQRSLWSKLRTHLNL
jgi:hypothetical protein